MAFPIEPYCSFMHIHLVPDGGLCNRMRAVDSAIALARENNWKLTVYWRQHRGILNCRFDRLFEPIQGVLIREVRGLPVGFDDSLWSRTRRWINAGLALSRQECGSILSGEYDKQLWQGHKSLYLISYSRFHPNKDHYAEFKPSLMVKQMLVHETAGFTRDTVGMHIRRTDNAKAIESSPLERFEAALDLEISQNDRVKCYVASDSVDIKKHLLAKYGDRVLCNLVQADRDSPEGVVQAAVELYALARTQRIYGSHWSSFSHTAAHIGGIPEYTVLKNEFKMVS